MSAPRELPGALGHACTPTCPVLYGCSQQYLPRMGSAQTSALRTDAAKGAAILVGHWILGADTTILVATARRV